MSHPPTIDVPEEVFPSLNELALQQGKTPETLARSWIHCRSGVGRRSLAAMGSCHRFRDFPSAREFVRKIGGIHKIG